MTQSSKYLDFGILSCERVEAVGGCGPEHHNANRLRETGEYLEMRERETDRQTDWGSGIWRNFIIPSLYQIFSRVTGCVMLRALKSLELRRRWYVTDGKFKVRVNI